MRKKRRKKNLSEEIPTFLKENYKGGLIGLGLSVLIAFTAFLTAFGNPTPSARLFLRIFGAIFAFGALPTNILFFLLGMLINYRIKKRKR